MDGIVAFTGAGISAPSGIPVFRGHGVRWEDVMPIESDEFFSIRFLRSEPDLFWELYLTRLIPALERAEPNPAHRALAAHAIPVITQNIDWLQEAAGSNDVLHLHGHAGWVLCPAGDRLSLEAVRKWHGAAPRCPQCGAGPCRPDVVFFGEPVHGVVDALERSAEATDLIVVGTSLRVAPANQVVFQAQHTGARVHLVDADCETRVPELLTTLLGEAGEASRGRREH